MSNNTNTTKAGNDFKPFTYLGLVFKPLRQLSKAEKKYNRFLQDLWGRTAETPEGWSHADFYRVAATVGADEIDLFEVDGDVRIPGENYLFYYKISKERAAEIKMEADKRDKETKGLLCKGCKADLTVPGMVTRTYLVTGRYNGKGYFDNTGSMNSTDDPDICTGCGANIPPVTYAILEKGEEVQRL